ncbi:MULTISPECIES: cysteine desulfurase-like protein [unclassified Leptolyngbya]|uniref:cysteine desulfurase-like protein n=1 Tax=unclassified Leptolyngbya TaxID=2650499 RepID=UPI001682AFDD|nr:MULTISPECIES: cysteine desulfurase-like protein [unclassified Leptolyngbya]MBD1910633.1 cysteine desulfurase-like protein [Leptolyngbya sp. FACHB-8]MBD2154573.1 cysteine desulfurase-like protein [Leptolyngbya sp. FACHB-16]
MTAPLQLDFVRSHFPSLAGDWIFFDNAGGSQTLQGVVDRLSEYLLTSNVQLGASYAVSQQATERVAKAAQGIATLVNATHPSEVVMGSSTSLLLRILSLSLGHTFEPGDEVVVTNCDHEANIGCWLDLQKRGVKINVWKIRPDTLQFDLADLEALMTPRTRLVAVTHASNILGTLNPVRAIADLVHAHGALICVDGVAYAPHRLVDVQALDVDFYVFSFYKVYGPHYAVMYGKREHLVKMPGINHFFIDGEQTPYKFQPGNVNFELSYSMLGLCDYLSAVAQHHEGDKAASDLRTQMVQAFERIAQYEEVLGDRLLSYLAQKPHVRIIGHPTANRELRVPTISFVVDGVDSSTIPSQVDPHHIGIRYGDFYARRLMDDLGFTAQNGVVRVSMVHYNTLEEVDRLIEVFETVL